MHFGIIRLCFQHLCLPFRPLPYLTWSITCRKSTGLHDRNFPGLPPTLVPFQKQTADCEAYATMSIHNIRHAQRQGARAYTRTHHLTIMNVLLLVCYDVQYMHMCIYTYMYIYIHTCVYVYVYIYIYTYTVMCMYTYIYIYICKRLSFDV